MVAPLRGTALMNHFRDAESFGPIRGDNVCLGCGKAGASVAKDSKGKAVRNLHACRSCQAELKGLRQAAEQRRKARGGK